MSGGFKEGNSEPSNMLEMATVPTSPTPCIQSLKPLYAANSSTHSLTNVLLEGVISWQQAADATFTSYQTNQLASSTGLWNAKAISAQAVLTSTSPQLWRQRGKLPSITDSRCSSTVKTGKYKIVTRTANMIRTHQRVSYGKVLRK